MKKSIFLSLICLIGLGNLQTIHAEKAIYGSLSADEQTFTLYYGEQKSPADVTDWYESSAINTEYVPHIVLDKSMENARPTSTRDWFHNFRFSKDITGLNYLNTSEVLDMSYMFYHCETLTALELNGFDTRKVTDMSYMFAGCYALKSLDVSRLDTRNVKDMSYMFYTCKAVTSLNLSNFDVNNVMNTKSMFAQCEKLETIYCEDDWSSKTKLTASEGMFWRNTSLQGGKGTKFTSANPGDVTYAHPDGGTVNPGYFTVVPKEIYTEFVEATGTLTYYYDANRKFHTGITEVYDPVNKPNVLRFESYHGQVEKAVMDVSMKNAPLTSTYNMFFGGGATCTLSKLTAIEGLANLNTENVTDMSQMFYNCLKLTSLDLSLFNTAKVTNMKSMFNNCQSLVTIYCNDDWSQSTVLTSSSSMFNACYKLVGENGTNCNGVSNVGITYARPDNGPDSSQPGYFTRADEAIEDIEAPKDKARKVITDGQLFIALPDGAIYDLQGTKVK